MGTQNLGNIDVHNVVMRKVHCSYMHWHVPFIGDLSESCTCGLIANREMKSMLWVSLLKRGWSNALIASCSDVAWRLTSHLVARALWVLMHSNEIGCYHIPTQNTTNPLSL